MKVDPRRVMQRVRPATARAALSVAMVAAAAVLAASQAQAIQCAQSRVDAYRNLIQPVAPGAMMRTHGPESPMSPPLDPNVGDSWLWYCWSLAGFPTPIQKMCTVRGEGEHVYIVVEDSQWGTRVDQADVDRMLLYWEHESFGPTPTQGIYDIDTYNFGPVPNELDNDPKVYVLYYDFDVSSDGFFWAFDEFPDGSQSFASNECEVLYMNSSDFDPGGDYLIGVQAHEFQHMIHWLADEDESSWVNEGASELAMWLFGKPDQVTAFPSNPDNNLTSWNSNFADYVKTYLWNLYLYEHFGGRDSIYNLVHQPANSTLGVQAMLTERGYTQTFAQVARDWMTANYLDDPTIAGGKYNYAGEDLPTFASALKSSYPVPTTNANVNHYAADYVRFINGVPQRLSFDGGDTSDWSARAIFYLAGTPLSVEDLPLSGTDAGFVDLPQFGSAYDQVVLVVANISNSGLTTYTYGTANEPAAVPGVDRSTQLALHLVSANPSSGDARFALRLPASCEIDASVVASDGRIVRHLAREWREGGASDLRWDGRDDAGATLPAGVYLVRLNAATEGTATHKVVLTR